MYLGGLVGCDIIECSLTMKKVGRSYFKQGRGGDERESNGWCLFTICWKSGMKDFAEVGRIFVSSLICNLGAAAAETPVAAFAA